jgi:hypothetical protein
MKAFASGKCSCCAVIRWPYASVSNALRSYIACKPAIVSPGHLCRCMHACAWLDFGKSRSKAVSYVSLICVCNVDHVVSSHQLE